MDRAEYMRIKGELVTAGDALQASRTEQRSVRETLQSWVNRLQSQKLTPESAQQAQEQIAKALCVQQQINTLEAEEARFRQALAGVPLPPA
ncbi:hypothetical protein [Aromatoleum aromaticum]|uniref:hypothetical protein n=1 Tax=Aromatoleum aromaticum TaxID=551760 RepID=UPI00145972E0|nr:hypothetical protein [Aromatoleum aromaticum]NMG56838.1 hypothetical protein [Aromatoleum aromaticum]